MISKPSATFVALASLLLADEATAVEAGLWELSLSSSIVIVFLPHPVSSSMLCATQVWRGIPAADYVPVYGSRHASAIKGVEPAEPSKKEGGESWWLLDRPMCGTVLTVAVVLAALGLVVRLPRWRELMCPADFALYVSS